MSYMICTMDDEGMIWDDPMVFDTIQECRDWANERDEKERPAPYQWAVFRLVEEYDWRGKG